MCWKSALASWRKSSSLKIPKRSEGALSQSECLWDRQCPTGISFLTHYSLAQVRIFGTIVIPRCASGFQIKLCSGFQKMSGTLTRLTLRALDSFARILPRKDSGPAHLHTGRSGEEAAYFYLREQGYVIIARNYRSPRSRS